MIYFVCIIGGFLMGLRCSLFADANWRVRNHLGMAAMHAVAVLMLAALGAGDMHILTFVGNALFYGLFFIPGHLAATALIQLACQYRMRRRPALA